SPFVFVDVLFDDTTKAFSQELRLTKKTDASTWIAGIFYSDDSVKANQRINTTQLFGGDPAVDDIGADVINNQDTTSIAVFANANFELSPKLTLLTGLRYTSEEKNWNGGSSFPALGVENMTELSIDDTDISGRIGLEYRPQDKTLVYATASKGFRSGGFPGGFAPLPVQLQPFQAENVFAYELGTKMTLLDNSLQFNAAAFFYDWQKIQTQFTESRGGIIAAFLTNAGDADIKGIEADINWAASEQLFIRAGINWMDTEISSDDDRLNNKQLANAQELTYNFAIEYFVPVNSDYEILFAFDASYTDEVFFTVTNEPVFHEDNYLLTNARISFMPTDGEWKVTLWGKNLGDKDYRVEGFNQFGFSGDSYFTYGEPASYGIRVSYEFL
ncbi:MAG: TonB-dependent receptor, partial [Kangiellaceae bacterium]|nr:TonB-dependent receptor [Kangiellaceae bacterium]